MTEIYIAKKGVPIFPIHPVILFQFSLLVYLEAQTYSMFNTFLEVAVVLVI